MCAPTARQVLASLIRLFHGSPATLRGYSWMSPVETTIYVDYEAIHPYEQSDGPPAGQIE